MWISVAPADSSGADLLLPPGLWGDGPGRTFLRYGIRRISVTVAVTPPHSQDPGAGRSPDRPVVVGIRPEIIQMLCIRTEPVYRLRPAQPGLEIGPVLGLLLGNRNHWYTGGYLNREPERVQEVYTRTGGLVVAFSPRNLSLRSGCAYGLFYDPGAGHWRHGALPIPSIVHRRSFHHAPEALDRLWELGIHVINSRRYTKWELHKILSDDEGFRRRLPETVQLTDGFEVFRLLERHASVVVKPAGLSRGRGILFVSGGGDQFRVTDCRGGGQPMQYTMGAEETARFLRQAVEGRGYLGQARIDLATVGGAPFDIRVVMQRCPDWRCTGIECRLAGQGQLVTNIAHGGRALWLEDAVEAAFGGAIDPSGVRHEVVALALRACQQLERTGESYGEFGIDLAMDRQGNLWFIEANVIPTFHGFEGLDRGTYRRLLAAPLLYAGYLAGFDVWG